MRRMSEAEEAPRGTGVRCHRRQDGHDGQDEHDVQDVQDGSLCAQWGQRKRSRRRTPAVSVGAFFALRLCRKKRPGIMDGRANVRIPGLSKGGDYPYPQAYPGFLSHTEEGFETQPRDELLLWA